MTLEDVIDLLSSEDEARLCPPGVAKPIAKSNVAKDDLFYLSDDFDTTTHLNDSWTESASKRRKISPLPDEDTVQSLPKLTKSRTAISNTQSTYENKAQEENDWEKNEVFDPIIFTSSAHAEISASRAKRRVIDSLSPHGDDSDDSLPDDIFPASLRPTNTASALSERTTALLATLSQPLPRRKLSNTRSNLGNKVDKGKLNAKSSVDDDRNSTGPDDEEGTQKKPIKTSRKPKPTDEERAAKVREKEREKETRKERKEKEREEEKEKKRLEKEEKAKEKRIAADIAEVNKSKLDKKESTPEMIVDLPASIDGESVDAQIRQFLQNLGVDATSYQSPIPNVIRWRRKTKARWNRELDYWEPLGRMQIENEKHVMCMMSAKDFVALAMVQREEQDIETHVARLKSAYDDCIPIYLIEGLQIWMRKNRTAENRAYQAKVLSQSQADEAPAGHQPKRKKAPVEIVDEDMIEDALLRLQVMNGCLVHHTTTSHETAEWVANFTQHISTIPYRHALPFPSFSLPKQKP